MVCLTAIVEFVAALRCFVLRHSELALPLHRIIATLLACSRLASASVPASLHHWPFLPTLTCGRKLQVVASAEAKGASNSKAEFASGRVRAARLHTCSIPPRSAAPDAQHVVLWQKDPNRKRNTASGVIRMDMNNPVLETKK